MTSIKIQTFSNKVLGDVRVFQQDDGEPVFCLADVCKVLDLQSGAIANQLKKYAKILSFGEEQGQKGFNSSNPLCEEQGQKGVNSSNPLCEEQGQKGVNSSNPLCEEQGQKGFNSSNPLCEEYKGLYIINIPTRGGTQPLNFISEANLYRCIFRSQKKNAILFQDWIFEEVLPSLRKNGGYMTVNKGETADEIKKRALRIAEEALKRKDKQLAEQQKQLAEQQKQIAEQQKQIAEQKNALVLKTKTIADQKKKIDNLYEDPLVIPEASKLINGCWDYIDSLEDQVKERDKTISEQAVYVKYFNTLLASPQTYTSTEIALTFGIRSAQELHKWLNDINVMHFKDGLWQITDEYTNCGYTTSRTYCFSGSTVQGTVWTERGKAFLFNLIQEHHCPWTKAQYK